MLSRIDQLKKMENTKVKITSYKSLNEELQILKSDRSGYRRIYELLFDKDVDFYGVINCLIRAIKMGENNLFPLVYMNVPPHRLNLFYQEFESILDFKLKRKELNFEMIQEFIDKDIRPLYNNRSLKPNDDQGGYDPFHINQTLSSIIIKSVSDAAIRNELIENDRLDSLLETVLDIGGRGETSYRLMESYTGSGLTNRNIGEILQEIRSLSREELSGRLGLLNKLAKELVKDNSPSNFSTYKLALFYTLHKLVPNKSYIRMYIETLSECENYFAGEYTRKTSSKDKVYIESLVKETRKNIKLAEDTLKIPKRTQFVDYIAEAGLRDEWNAMHDMFEDVDVLLSEGAIARKAVAATKEATQKINKLKFKEKRFWEKIESVEKKIRDDWKQSKNDEFNERVVEQSVNLTKMLRKVTLYAGGAMLGGVPAMISIFALVVDIVTHKKAKKQARARVLKELEIELKMVKEKIKDAESDNNRKAKYQLMRLESELEKNIEKVKYSAEAHK